MQRAIPDTILKPFLIAREGEKFVVYADDGGRPTWGIGHLDLAAKVGEKKTQAQVDSAYLADTETARNRLYDECKAIALEAISDHQYAALLSFTFNLGEHKDATLWTLISKGQFKAVPDELMKWNHSGGKVDPGLTNRRKAECALWNTKDAK